MNTMALSTEVAKADKKVKRKKRIRKWLLISILALISTYFMSNGNMFESFRRFYITVTWTLAMWYSQWIGNGYLSDWLDTKYTWLYDGGKRLALGIIGHAVYSSLAACAVHVAMYYIFFGGLREGFREDLMYSALIATSISFVFSFFFNTTGFLKGWRAEAAAREAIQKEMMQYKYTSLRNQLQPHFLFNSLNVLSDLVYEDQKMAVKFIRQLSDVYRYVLDSDMEELTTVSQEMKVLESYTFLLQSRFEGGLEIDIKTNNIQNKFLVPMSLQLLLENAIKHNETSRERPLKVSVYDENDYLVVKNNFQPKSNVSSGGIGLENIKSRFAFFTEKPVQIIEGDDFIVKIPLIENSPVA